jgi:hypothetical protein
MIYPARFLMAVALLLTASGFARDYRLSLAAPTADFAGQVISFRLPADAAKPAALRDASGKIIPLQTDADGTARFIVPTQKSGQALSFTLTPAAPTGAPTTGVTVSSEPGDLRVTVGGQPVLSYRVDPAAVPRADLKPEILRAGYIHPVFSPAGHLVTDDYPSSATGASFRSQTGKSWRTRTKKRSEHHRS